MYVFMLYVNRGELHDGLVFKRCMSGSYIVLLCVVLSVFLFAMAPFIGILTLPALAEYFAVYRGVCTVLAGTPVWKIIGKAKSAPLIKQRGAFYYGCLSARQEAAEAFAVFGAGRHRRSSRRCRTRLAAQKYRYAMSLGFTSSREEKPKEAV